jgi:hypothetical protein
MLCVTDLAQVQWTMDLFLGVERWKRSAQLLGARSYATPLVGTLPDASATIVPLAAPTRRVECHWTRSMIYLHELLLVRLSNHLCTTTGLIDATEKNNYMRSWIIGMNILLFEWSTALGGNLRMSCISFVRFHWTEYPTSFSNQPIWLPKMRSSHHCCKICSLLQKNLESNIFLCMLHFVVL